MLEPYFVDGKTEPADSEIKKALGKSFPLYRNLLDFITKNYSIQPEKVFYGKKYGWILRCRKSGKTLCSIYPCKNRLIVNIILGKAEVEKVKAIKKELSEPVWKTFKTTKQLHDGRWLWVEVGGEEELNSVNKLLQIKRRVKNSAL